MINYIIYSIIISSSEFSRTSKSTQFPIVIALYKKDMQSMVYEDILNHVFTTKEGQ
ncbi:MAG: hypothetical protein FWE18_03780 [Alphaproteobacteria bacterium]|nr:hypothetical protein [Alphaproteobacteria bacterium]